MKKKLALMLSVLCALAAVSGCSGSTPAETEFVTTSKEEMTDWAEENDNEIYQQKETTVLCKATDEIINAEPFSNKVQIMDKVYTYPFTVSELVKNSGGTIELTELYGDKWYTLIYLHIDDVELSLGVTHLDEADDDINNYIVDSVSYEPHGSDPAGVLYLPKGIGYMTPVTDLDTEYGEPYLRIGDFSREYGKKYYHNNTKFISLENVYQIDTDSDVEYVESVCARFHEDYSTVSDIYTETDTGKTLFFTAPEFLFNELCAIVHNGEIYSVYCEIDDCGKTRPIQYTDEVLSSLYADKTAEDPNFSYSYSMVENVNSVIITKKTFSSEYVETVIEYLNENTEFYTIAFGIGSHRESVLTEDLTMYFDDIISETAESILILETE